MFSFDAPIEPRSTSMKSAVGRRELSAEVGWHGLTLLSILGVAAVLGIFDQLLELPEWARVVAGILIVVTCGRFDMLLD